MKQLLGLDLLVFYAVYTAAAGIALVRVVVWIHRQFGELAGRCGHDRPRRRYVRAGPLRAAGDVRRNRITMTPREKRPGSPSERAVDSNAAGRRHADNPRTDEVPACSGCPTGADAAREACNQLVRPCSKIRNMRGMIRRTSRESFNIRPGRTLGSAGCASSFLNRVSQGLQQGWLATLAMGRHAGQRASLSRAADMASSGASVRTWWMTAPSALTNAITPDCAASTSAMSKNQTAGRGIAA